MSRSRTKARLVCCPCRQKIFHLHGVTLFTCMGTYPCKWKVRTFFCHFFVPSASEKCELFFGIFFGSPESEKCELSFGIFLDLYQMKSATTCKSKAGHPVNEKCELSFGTQYNPKLSIKFLNFLIFHLTVWGLINRLWGYFLLKDVFLVCICSASSS